MSDRNKPDIIGQMDGIRPVIEAATTSMQAFGEGLERFGAELRRFVESAVAELNSQERDAYDRMLAKGVLPLDALVALEETRETDLTPKADAPKRHSRKSR